MKDDSKSFEYRSDSISERLSRLEKSVDSLSAANRRIEERLSALEGKLTENFETVSGFLRLVAANQLMILQEAYDPDATTDSGMTAAGVRQKETDAARLPADVQRNNKPKLSLSSAAKVADKEAVAKAAQPKAPASSKSIGYSLLQAKATKSLSSSSDAKPAVYPLHRWSAEDLCIGDRFEFGRYPQDQYGVLMPIVWMVLARDSYGLLVIAENGLAYEPYNDSFSSINWFSCSLRRWLNDKFFFRAFNERERFRIPLCRCVNNPGLPSEDRVFLLSADEASCFFAFDKERRAKPTDFALSCSSVGNSGGNASGYCWWWLRSTNVSNNALFIDSGGGINNSGTDVCSRNCTVRPVIRITI